MDGGAWWAADHGVTKSRTWLSNFTFTFHFHALEKEMATHSSVLAWRIPGMGKPGGLLSMGLHRVGHVWSDLAAAAAAGSSAPWVLQARVLEWVAIYFSRRSSWPRNQTCVFCVLHWQPDSLPLNHLCMVHRGLVISLTVFLMLSDNDSVFTVLGWPKS